MIQDVILYYNQLLKCLKELKTKFSSYREDYYVIVINTRWEKLDKYYKTLDKLPILYIAVRLYPHLKNIFNTLQAENLAQIIKGDKGFKEIQAIY